MSRARNCRSEFGTQNHDFTYAMPVLSVGTHSIAIYAMDPSDEFHYSSGYDLCDEPELTYLTTIIT